MDTPPAASAVTVVPIDSGHVLATFGPSMVAAKNTLQERVGFYLARLKGEGVRAILLRGAGGAFSVSVLGTGVSFVTHVLVARLAGAANYGYYVYPLAWLNLLTLPGTLGFDTATLRFVNEYEATNNWSLLRGFIGRSHQIALASSVVLAALTAAIVWIIRARLPAELTWTFWIACLILPTNVMIHMGGAVLHALRRIVLARAPIEIFRPLVLILGVSTIVALGEPLTGAIVMVLNLIATIVTLLVVRSLVSRALPDLVGSSRPAYKADEWISAALPLLLISGFHLVIAQTDILMVGAFLGTTVAGIYTAASRTATLITFGLSAVNAIAAPLISQLHTQRRMNELQRLVTFATRGLFAFSLPVSLALIVGGKLVLGMFGPDFVRAYGALVILIIGQLVNALAGPVGFLMTMTGHHKEAAWAIGGSAILNIILNGVLIPLWGMEGAALATAIATTSWNAILIVQVWKRLGLRAIIA